MNISVAYGVWFDFLIELQFKTGFLQILEWIKTTQKEICQADGVIVCGDFNTTPDSQVYTIMEENGFKSAVFEQFGQEQNTYPTRSFTYSTSHELDVRSKPYDYVWYKGDMTFQSSQIIGTDDFVWIKDEQNKMRKIYISDHFGILAKFAI